MTAFIGSVPLRRPPLGVIFEIFLGVSGIFATLPPVFGDFAGFLR